MSRKLYICEKCDRKFNSKEYLRKHLQRKTPCNEIYKCNKCDKLFKNESLLKRHNGRKTPCAPETIPIIKGNNEENKCHLCGKTYTTSFNLRRHQKTCTVKDNPDMLKRLLEEQIKSNELMSKILKNGLGDQITINNNNITNVQQNNLYMNVTVVPFGNENYDKLDQTVVMNLVKNHAAEFIPKMIEYIHTNPDIPEYHNVFYDKELKFAIVYRPVSDDTKSWVKEDIKEVSDQLTDKIQNHMHPMQGPYFNIAMQEKDTDIANQIIKIANSPNLKVTTFEKNKEVLSKLGESEQFMKIIDMDE